MKKAEIIKQYNQENEHYNITGIETLTEAEIDAWENYASESLSDLYKRPSDAKVYSWNVIVRTYNPVKVYGFRGNSQTYSVLLRAQNGDLLHITRDNNYLVKVK